MKEVPSALALLASAAGGLPEWQDGDLIAWLLILLLGVALGIGIAGLLLVVHFARQGRPLPQRRLRRAELVSAATRRTGSAVPMPTRWLAVQSTNAALVQDALGLRNPTPCSWEEGLSAAQDKRLFISPPIAGWIVVMGGNLPDPADDVDRLFKFLMDLSRRVGRVQYFSINRVVHHHAWADVTDGVVARAYAWAGRTLWNQGAMTSAESSLSMACLAYGETPDPVAFGQVDPMAANTERVCLLASRWSVDLSSIDARTLKQSHGVAGRVARSKA
ncbi:MAG TPA: hypothetical protein VNO52_01150 [Methylomirabilota bacterium]|nr:hypothetical protein [Methylomirabilota bacterium]